MKVIISRTGQAHISEYALSTFIILAVIASMTVYFKRTIQAKVFDARRAMQDTVVTRAAGSVPGNVYSHYEPYYLESDGNMITSSSVRQSLGGALGSRSGLFTKEIDESTEVTAISITKPPAERD